MDELVKIGITAVVHIGNRSGPTDLSIPILPGDHRDHARMQDRAEMRILNFGHHFACAVLRVRRHIGNRIDLARWNVHGIQLIERRIYLIRGQKVMLDFDLAELYGVTTGNLNLAVRRNENRFPEDFMFQLTAEETESLILQIARSKGRGGRRKPISAFTEHGVAMLSINIFL